MAFRQVTIAIYAMPCIADCFYSAEPVSQMLHMSIAIGAKCHRSVTFVVISNSSIVIITTIILTTIATPPRCHVRGLASGLKKALARNCGQL
jgi:hypothetical protein